MLNTQRPVAESERAGGIAIYCDVIREKGRAIFLQLSQVCQALARILYNQSAQKSAGAVWATPA